MIRQRRCRAGRQRQQHVAGESAVRRVHAHLPRESESLADDVRQVVENLRQVAAGLALDRHRRDEEADVESGTRSAISFSASRSGRPKFCWSKVFLNSGPTGVGSSSATMPSAVWNAWPARMRARQQVERSGNCSSNFLRRVERRWISHSTRQRMPSEQAASGRGRRRHGQTSHADADKTPATAADQHDRARRGAHAGLLDQLRQASPGAGLAPRSVEAGQRPLLALPHDDARLGLDGRRRPTSRSRCPSRLLASVAGRSR